MNSCACKVPFESLDPKLVKHIRLSSKNWGFDDLQKEMRKYPKPFFETVEHEVQASCMGEPSPTQVIPPTHDQSHLLKDRVHEWLKEIDHNHTYFLAQKEVDFLAELSKEIEGNFHF